MYDNDNQIEDGQIEDGQIEDGQFDESQDLSTLDLQVPSDLEAAPERATAEVAAEPKKGFFSRLGFGVGLSSFKTSIFSKFGSKPKSADVEAALDTQPEQDEDVAGHVGFFDDIVTNMNIHIYFILIAKRYF
jgi:hypothetical protein